MAIITNATFMSNRPMAIKGLTSYRYNGRFGYIMIGATDHMDALREASQSTPNPVMESLEVWNGLKYVPVV